MPRNRLQRIVPDRLAAVAATVAEGVGPHAPNAFSVPQGAIDDLAVARESFAQAQSRLSEARALYHGAVRAHDTARAKCADAVAAVANVCYASPGVTPPMIAALGLSPRSTSLVRAAPQTAMGLVALPQTNGNVLLKWDRSGNRDGVSFVVEARAAAGPWTFVASTSRVRLTLSGHGSGAEASFRVTATTNDRRATPSNVATIFEGSAALRIAA